MTTLENNARKLLAELGDAIDQLSKENQRLRAIVDGGEHLAMPQSAQAKQALRSLFKRNTSSRAHTRRVIECTARIEQAHGDGINDLAAAWSERGVIASASVDGSARVWRFRDVQGGHLNYTGHAHGSSVNSVAWHPTDSALLLTAGGDGSAHIVCIPSYNSSQWSPRHAKSRNLSNPGTTFSSECSSHGLKKPLSRAVWMYNGKVVVTSDLAGVVSVWNVSRPECPFSELKGHSQAVTHIDVSGDVVVSASEDSNAHLWDLRYSVDPVHVFSSHSARINSTVISAPGSSIQMIATAGEDRLVKLWDYRSLTKPIVEISCASAANKVAFAPSGLSITCPFDDGSIHSYNCLNGDLVSEMNTKKSPDRMVTAVSWSRDEQVCYSTGWDRNIYAWELPSVVAPAILENRTQLPGVSTVPSLS